jgi:hypothetical protein
MAFRTTALDTEPDLGADFTVRIGFLATDPGCGLAESAFSALLTADFLFAFIVMIDAP